MSLRSAKIPKFALEVVQNVFLYYYLNYHSYLNGTTI